MNLMIWRLCTERGFRIGLRKCTYSVCSSGDVFLISLRHLPNSIQNSSTFRTQFRIVTRYVHVFVYRENLDSNHTLLGLIHPPGRGMEREERWQCQWHSLSLSLSHLLCGRRSVEVVNAVDDRRCRRRRSDSWSLGRAGGGGGMARMYALYLYTSSGKENK